MEGDALQQEQAVSTDPKNKANKTAPTLQEQFDALVNQKNAIWDSIKGNYTNPYDFSFRQTDAYRKIEGIDTELFKLEAKLKEVV